MATNVLDTYTGGPAKPTIVKDPSALLDYSFDWSAYLTPLGDTIASVVFVLGNGLVEESKNFTATGAVVWLSGGALNTTAGVTCRITTIGGRTDDRTVFLKIAER